MFKHVFVTTDGSRCGNAALSLAAGLARTCGARITAACALPEVLGVYEGPYTRDAGHEYARALTRGQDILKAAAAELGPGTETVLLDARVGDVAGCLLEGARAVGADVIVVSTHGRGGLRRALLGSVAERVLRHARVPVLLVRGDQAGSQEEVGRPGEAGPGRAVSGDAPAHHKGEAT